MNEETKEPLREWIQEHAELSKVCSNLDIVADALSESLGLLRRTIATSNDASGLEGSESRLSDAREFVRVAQSQAHERLDIARQQQAREHNTPF